MARISKTQIYAIRWLHSQKKTVEEISEELGIGIKQIKTLVNESFEHPQEPSIQNASSSAKNNMMLNKTNGKQNNNVTILTKEASAHADSVRSKSSQETKTKNPNSIFKIHDK